MAHHELLLQTAFRRSSHSSVLHQHPEIQPRLGLVVPPAVKHRPMGPFRCSILSVVGTASGDNIALFLSSTF